MSYRWSKWRVFPHPLHGEILHAPIGPGVYEIRRASGNRRLVLVGIGRCCATRMTSLLPSPWGSGTRNNKAKRAYVKRHLSDIEYRTRPCRSREEAAEIEREMLARSRYVFGT